MLPDPNPDLVATPDAPPDPTAPGEADTIGTLAALIARAARFDGDPHGLDRGQRAALARLDPDGELRPHQLAALTRALLYAGLDPARWLPETWRRWVLIAHGMALAGHAVGALGEQLARADVSEARVTRLLTARGKALTQALPSLLRLLAAREVAPNWYPLATLILHETDDERAEPVRLRIAGSYFAKRDATAAPAAH